MSRSSSVSRVLPNLWDAFRSGTVEFRSGRGNVLAGGSSDLPEARPLASGMNGLWSLIASFGAAAGEGASPGTARWKVPAAVIPGLRLIQTMRRVRTKIARLRQTGRVRGLTAGSRPPRTTGNGSRVTEERPRTADGGQGTGDSGQETADGGQGAVDAIRGLTPPARQAPACGKNAVGAQAPKGFTLVEMLVVLTVLAVLAAVALQAIEPVADQARYEATQNSLTGLIAAMLGPDGLRQPDGTPLITGFVADIGRPPVLQGTDPATQLHELWDSSSTLATSFPFQTRSGPGAPTDYSDIALPCGWRGPYLRLGVGATELRDGWGSAFVLTADGSSRLETATWPAVSPYTTDLVADAEAGLVEVSGTVTNNHVPPGAATVVLLYPDPTQSELQVMADADMAVGTFTFNNVPVGLRAIRAVIDGNEVTRYVLVPRTGLSLSLNYSPP